MCQYVLTRSGLYSLLFLKVLLSVLHSVLQYSPRENEVFYDVVAIVDPLTRDAQKMSALLIVSCVLVPFFILCQDKGPINPKQNV